MRSLRSSAVTIRNTIRTFFHRFSQMDTDFQNSEGFPPVRNLCKSHQSVDKTAGIFAAKDRKDRKAESTPLEGIRPFCAVCASLRPICCAASLFLLTAPDENEAVRPMRTRADATERVPPCAETGRNRRSGLPDACRTPYPFSRFSVDIFAACSGCPEPPKNHQRGKLFFSAGALRGGVAGCDPFHGVADQGLA